jgi:hypothetical protein
MSNGDPSKDFRQIAHKRIVDPDDPDPANPTNYVDVPVTLGITFMLDRQRIYRTYDNTGANTVRNTRVRAVKNRSTDSGGITVDESNKLNVERVGHVEHINADVKEFHYFITNEPVDDSDTSTDSVAKLGHKNSVVVRYNKDNVSDPDSTPWVDVELVTEMQVMGQRRERDVEPGIAGAAQQSFIHIMADSGDRSFSDPNDPFNPAWADKDFWQTQGWNFKGIMSYPDTNGNPDPVRLDPLQNIVNVNWGEGLAVEFFDGAT